MFWTNWPVFTSAVGVQYPDDIVSGASHFYGLRPYSTAKIGSAGVRLIRSPGGAEADIALTASGLDLADPFFNGSTYTVRTWYDQIGGIDAIQAVDAFCPAFVLNGKGSLPVIRWVAASTNFMDSSASASAINLPVTSTFVASVTDSGARQYLFNDSTDQGDYIIRETAGTAEFRSDANAVSAASVFGVGWLSLIGVLAGSSGSIMYTNGSAGAGASATQGVAAGVYHLGRINPGGTYLNADTTEFGLWPSQFNGTQATNMYNNQRTYYGL